MHLGLLSVGLLIAPNVHREWVVVNLSAGFCSGHHCAIDAQRHLLTIIDSQHIMPMVLPIGRQLAFCLVELICEDIEIDVFLAVLLNAQLIAALRDERAAVANKGTREYAHSDGELVAVDLHILIAIDLYPLVVSIQIEHRLCAFLLACFHQLGITHQVGRGMVRRCILHQSGFLREARADEVPNSASQAAWLCIDHTPIIVQCASTIASHTEVLVHERRTGIAIAMQAYL